MPREERLQATSCTLQAYIERSAARCRSTKYYGTVGHVAVLLVTFPPPVVLPRRYSETRLDYIHHNPVSKKWQLLEDFTNYEYSIAFFYEKGIKKYENLVHINDALNLVPGSPLPQSHPMKTPG